VSGQHRSSPEIEQEQEQEEEDWSLVVLPGAGPVDDEPAPDGAISSEVVLPDHSSRSGLLSA
jgi:hypothetical protein